jgi:GNAT superfamily N-acetyltransferase
VTAVRPLRRDEYADWAAVRQADYLASLLETRPRDAAERKAAQDEAAALSSGFDTPDNVFLVAERDGSVVGSVWLSLVEPQTGSREQGWVYDLRVDPAARRTGVGDLLMAAAEDAARDAGAARLGLNVFGGNEPAVALYARRGYAVTTMQMAKRL